MLKFKVVGERTGQPIGFGRSVLRQFAHVVDAVICYVGFLFPLWDAQAADPRRQADVTTVCRAGQRNALTPVSASPMTSWCTSEVPS